MTSLTKLKLGLTIIGLILFFYGVRVDSTTLRMIAIGFVAVASLLRFAKRDKDADTLDEQSAPKE
ncbi:MAG: hypothetical protein IT360_17145 [Gemmatimonadaceae bacterium]|nr:hypothetical protein [Gemmatimonadaceae bacterium]